MLAVALAWVIALRRGGKPERPGAVTMRRFTHWALACTMPLMLYSAAKAQFSQTYEDYRQTTMRGYLRRVVAAEEKSQADSGHFTVTPILDPAPGISYPAITLTANGWTARVTPSVTPRFCTVYVGDTVLPPASVEGQPRCTKEPLLTARIIQGVGVMLLGILAGLLVVKITPVRRHHVAGEHLVTVD